MIYVDLNQVMIANIMIEVHRNKTKQLDENLIRHMVLNSLRKYVSTFKKDYGEVIICCDNPRSWRKKYFPNYKANRKKDREASPIDWVTILKTLNLLRDELKAFFPYKVLEVEGAEADDLIAVLASHVHEKSIILSSDKDFVQLQKYPHIKQYSPILDRNIFDKNPEKFLKELILKGDSGDGIPNFLSSDNCFVLKERQKPISKKNLETWLLSKPTEFCQTETMKRGFARNQTLIDFEYIPNELQTNILRAWNEAPKAPASKLMGYFMEKKLGVMLSKIDEFY